MKHVDRNIPESNNRWKSSPSDILRSHSKGWPCRLWEGDGVFVDADGIEMNLPIGNLMKDQIAAKNNTAVAIFDFILLT